MGQKIRAKLDCYHIEEDGTVHLCAVVSDGEGNENDQFSEATPFAEMAIRVDNPKAKGFFKSGKEYYLDFSEAPEN